MKLTKILVALAIAALASTAFASFASATTLEITGVTQTGALTIKASLKPGTSALLTDTSGFFINTWTVSTIEGRDSTRTTGTRVEGPIEVLSFGTAVTPGTEGNPTVDARGSFSIERIGTTTNGTLRSSNTKLTVPSALGLLTCITPAEGTDLGTLTGVAEGNATMDISAILNCGISTKLTATYLVTSPEKLGVVG